MGKADAYIAPEYADRLRGVVALGWTPQTIRAASDDMLVTMQYRLGMGKQWGLWEIPEHFVPTGTMRNESNLKHKLVHYLPDGMACDAPEACEAWREILRFAIARSVFPSVKGGIPLPATVVSDLKILKQPVSKILQCPPNTGTFWSRLQEADVLPTHNGKKVRAALVRTIARLYQMGCLPDCFQSTRTIQGDEPERDRHGLPEHQENINSEKQWQPLPDTFVCEMGWRSLRVIKVIAPVLLDALEAALAVVADTRPNGKLNTIRTAKDKTREARDAVISRWDWKTADGKSLGALGFDCTAYHPKGNSVSLLEWPPSSFGVAFSFATQLLKPAHLWAILMGNGNRNSEASSMRDDCLVEAANGNYRWKGKTYKMTGVVGGREYDAIVPDLITQSIVQQIRLARITRAITGFAGNSLWAGRKAAESKSLTKVLNRYVDVLKLRHLLSDDNPSCHVHRFRKTLARLVALSLVNAPLILKDCFGHDDIDMTIRRYILSDPSIAQEVLTIQKELVVLKALDVINNLDTASGPGADGLRQRKVEYLKRIGKSAFEPQDAYEFARRETFDGRSWMVVGPSILCTAPHDMDAGGPCNAGQRGPNPAYCRTGCSYQVLENYGMTVADDTVSFILANLQRAVTEDAEMLVSMWAGQLKAWLYRYEEVAEKWKDHRLVKQYGQRPIRVLQESV